MSKTLWLMRHAHAAWPKNGQKDFERELDVAGKTDALSMASHFADFNNKPTYVISSSAMRTRQTTFLVKDSWKIKDENLRFSDALYEASQRKLLEIVEMLPNAAQSVLIVTHNPGISLLANYLMGAERLHFACGAVAILNLEIETWAMASRGTAHLLSYADPSSLPHI